MSAAGTRQAVRDTERGEGGLAVTDEERDVSSGRRRLAAALVSPFLHAAALTAGAGGLVLVARWQRCNAFAVNVSRGETSWSWFAVVWYALPGFEVGPSAGLVSGRRGPRGAPTARGLTRRRAAPARAA